APAKKVAKKAVAKKTVAKKTVSKAPARKLATKKSVAKKPAARKAVKKAAPRKAPVKKAVAKKAVAKKGAAKNVTRETTARKSTTKPRRITPAKALANTRKLLEAKQQHDQQPQPWQALDPEHGHQPNAGFQSAGAAAKAEELHAAESRMQGIQGSNSTHDRHNQGKRDNR